MQINVYDLNSRLIQNAQRFKVCLLDIYRHFVEESEHVISIKLFGGGGGNAFHI